MYCDVAGTELRRSAIGPNRLLPALLIGTSSLAGCSSTVYCGSTWAEGDVIDVPYADGVNP